MDPKDERLKQARASLVKSGKEKWRPATRLPAAVSGTNKRQNPPCHPLQKEGITIKGIDSRLTRSWMITSYITKQIHGVGESMRLPDGVYTDFIKVLATMEEKDKVDLPTSD